MIGKYELLRCVGRGGMGSVWEARHVSLGTTVAIKFVEESVDNPDARRRFENEARAAAALRSSHAIRIFDHGVSEDGKPYIVMELLVGEGLDARLARVGRLTIAETANVLGQACRALQNAHDESIVHRDLKPENLFFAREADEDSEIVKVVDFGIAKIRKPGDLDSSANTRSGTVLGTPFYMAPEQARGLRDVDHRADLWSLGVIAYECVVGRLPFDAATVGSLLVEICAAPIPVPSSVSSSVPKAFDTWFARAVARDPNARFSSATELASALAQLAEEDVATTQPMPAASASSPRGSRRFVAALFASFAVTLGALAAVHSVTALEHKPTVLASAGIVSAAREEGAPVIASADAPIATLSPPEEITSASPPPKQPVKRAPAAAATASPAASVLGPGF